MRITGRAAAALIALLCLTGCAWESSVPYEPTAHHTDPPTTTVTVLRRRKEETTAPAIDVTDPAVTDALDPEEEELDRRLRAIYELQPVPIPEGGWTDETLLPLLSIGGKPAELPFCMGEMLYGYTVLSDDSGNCAANAAQIYCKDMILHNEACSLMKPFAADDAALSFEMPPIIALGAEWAVIMADGSQRYPITVNCICIGSTTDAVEQYLTGADSIEDADEGRFRCYAETDSVRIIISGENGVVDTIIFHDRTE